jgi:lipopolysaccharide/colanic/teichoic acid biosynthesis glycosyltransferase
MGNQTQFEDLGTNWGRSGAFGTCVAPEGAYPFLDHRPSLAGFAVLKLTPVPRSLPFSAPAGVFGLEFAETLFALSRRTEQALSVVSLEIGANGAAGGPDFGHLEPVIAASLRRTDALVRWCAEDDIAHYAVFCPCTNAEGAKALIHRVSTILSPCSVRGGVAAFPLDGLVLDELIEQALAEACGRNESEALGRGDAALVRRPLVSRLDRTTKRRAAALAKRAFDLVFSMLTAPVWLPAIALVALAIKISAPRAPVMFAQMRTGRGGHRFHMFKFRTMVPNAEGLKQSYAHLNQLSWPDFKVENDPRVTRLGRFLRKTSLDELPQVFNVLRGEMSWVGPRPTSFGPETYAVWQTARLDVVPGVTGLWQVVGRGRTDLDERLRLDMEYIDQRSLWFDLKILFLTVGEVIRPRGGC